MVATTRAIGRAGRGAELWLPAGVFAVALATIAYGWTARAAGVELGASLAPFLWDWRPALGSGALPAAALLAGGVALAPRIAAPAVRPLTFAAATLALGLSLRIALGTARRGPEELWAVYQLGNHEAASEYLPALPIFDFGARFALDTFAEVGASLPVHSIGHPPGLLLLLHWLGIDDAQAMAALTIGVGALSIPLAYLLARSLLGDSRGRTATLLYVFAPSAILYGATSADALYATAGLAAALPLAIAARDGRSSRVALPAGGAAFAVATFFSYANLAIGAWAALVAALRGRRRRALALAAWCGAALLAFYGLLHLATGYDPIGVLQATESVYREGIASRRPYAFWVLGSPVAFLVATGLPIAWLALRAAGARNAPALALFGVVAIAAVLGFSKAETERIWQFLVPLACIAAAVSLPARRVPLVLGLLAAQALATELLVYTVW
jgi:methylthioxylose transferase